MLKQRSASIVISLLAAVASGPGVSVMLLLPTGLRLWKPCDQTGAPVAAKGRLPSILG